MTDDMAVDVTLHIDDLLMAFNEVASPTKVAKIVAKLSGIKKNDLYDRALRLGSAD